MAADPSVGLSAAEVAARVARGEVNVATDDIGRTVGDIIRANVFTRFNAILGSLLVVILAIGDFRDALFGIVLVTNALIGIVQEWRAKTVLDRLSLVSVPRVTVVRDSQETQILPDEVVVEDVVDLRAGDQVPVDGRVLLSERLEVDEALLTGESDPVLKRPGDEVLSGSFVVAGSGRFAATAIGDDAYAQRLAKEAKRFATVHSELRSGIDTILRIGTWALGPVALLLVVSQMEAVSSVREALRGSVAGVAAMIPEGLVLLTSIAFAVGAIRLGRRRALVQELAAVEVLARVDVVCVDKTGTLTEPALQLTSIETIDATVSRDDVMSALGGLAATDENPNASMRAIATDCADPRWPVEAVAAFSSARRWSGATFTDHGTWLLGAPEALLHQSSPWRDRGEQLAQSGMRVMVVAHGGAPLRDDGEAPSCEAVAIIALEERIRDEAPGTIAYFAEQGVAVKVISGDHPSTVAAIAERVGVAGAANQVDGRTLPDDLDELGDVLEAASVFGRVQPHQKQAIVHSLQRRGHVVAMTGDGVNDVLALKHADIGVAMGSGSGASRSVAELVLLDDSFASLPHVVAEGRRVIGNVERVANLFVTKSVYAAFLAVAVGIAGLPFPFFPRHLTVISSLTIGIPAFFLALAPNTSRSRPGFVGRVARFAIPAGIVAASATFAGYATAGTLPGVTSVEERTTAVIVLFLVAMWVLVILARPLNEWKVGLLTAMAVAFVVLLSTPWLRQFFYLRIPPTLVTLAGVGVAALAIALLEAGWQAVDWNRRRRGEST